jgi:uncharacterized protein (DUF433 family)
MSSESTPVLAADTTPEQWLVHRATSALVELSDCVERNPAKLGGVPVIKGTRISVAQVLAELGEGRNTEEVAADFDLDEALLRRLVQGLAISLDQAVST